MKILVGILIIFGITAVQSDLVYQGSRDSFHTYLLNGRPVTISESTYQRLPSNSADAEQVLLSILKKRNPQGVSNYKQDPTQAELGESQAQNSFNKRPSSQSSGTLQFPISNQESRPQDSYRPSSINWEGSGDVAGQAGNQGNLPSRPNTGHAQIPRDRDNDDYRNQDAITVFAWNLFKNSNGPGNFVLSPLSPQILLSYLAWVADGVTRRELTGAIGYGSPKQIQEVVRSMLKPTKGRELDIATAFFTSKEMTLNKEFLEKSINNVDVVEVDFKNPGDASNTISRWAKSKTRGGLKLNEVNYPPSTKIAMTSAIYYKGKFVYTFEEAKPGQFFAENNRAVTVPMMSMNRKFRWGKVGEIAEWVAIPYESSEAMVIILPNEGEDVDNVINQLGGQSIERILRVIDSETTKAKVNLTMPKFKMESTTSLIEPLKKMRVSALFTPRAELPYLSDYDAVEVTNAEQQASMEVNEEGTVVIAFTNLNVVALSFQPPIPSVEFKVNRPFIAIVADVRRKVPLMMAKVTNPIA